MEVEATKRSAINRRNHVAIQRKCIQASQAAEERRAEGRQVVSVENESCELWARESARRNVRQLVAAQVEQFKVGNGHRA